ncbi:MAG: TauD/TfdA family dioxygenase, partial [Novosphingobium sp.]|nr:TauD/TfdA family dioxygenase [Novosphingobium sp.]
MKITPLSPALGARIEQFDPREGSEADWDALRKALFETHHLLLFRGLALSDEEHVEFCSHFGPLGMVGNDNTKRFSYISNVRPDGILGAIEASWHFDYAFTDSPLEAISLYGSDLGGNGAPTLFANAKRAAASVPQDLAARLLGLTVRNAVDVAAPEREAGVRIRMKRLDESYPHHVREVLWPHWRTGEPLLSVNEQQSDAVIGLPESESVALIEELFGHLYEPENIYAHHWQPNDLIIWDNHALHHARPEVGERLPRTLRRVSIGKSPDLSIYDPSRTGG